MDGRLTPVISQSSRSTRRWPGFRVPDMIASRSFCATIERTVGTSSIRSVDCNSPRLSIVYRLRIGIRFNSDLRAESSSPQSEHGRWLLPSGSMSRCAHAMDQPPSIGRVAPVMSCAAGLHRKTAIAPTPSMATNRPVGCRVAR